MITQREYTSDQYEAIEVKIKALLFITDATFDDYFEVAVPGLFQDAENYCNRYFSEDDAAESGDWIMDIPNQVYLYLSKAIEEVLQKAGVASETQGKRSITYDMAGDTSKWKAQFLRPLRRLDWEINNSEYVTNVNE